VPRDLWVPIAGQDTTDRINTAYSYDANTLIATVQDALDIDIHHYASIDFAGFQDVVNEVGGVPMYFDTIYQDTNSGFVISDPGCVTLDGYMALAFVRSRHLQYMDEAGYWQSDPTGDLGRISRQQVFIRRALDQARGSLSILRPDEMNAMLDIGIDHVTLDSELPPTELAAMGQRFAEFEGDSIETHTLEVEPFTTDGGAAVVRLDEAGSQQALNIFRGLPRDFVDPAAIDLTVLNGSGIPGQAAEVKEAFEAIGFTVGQPTDVPGTSDDPLEGTRVRYAPGAEAYADLVERHLTAGGELEEDPDLSAGEVVVDTGLDFTTVEQVAREPDADDAPSASTVTTAPPSPTTTAIGHVTGNPPDGEECG
jgi:LCP family protein required for cell wall assembly